jgi:hypothetical protein
MKEEWSLSFVCILGLIAFIINIFSLYCSYFKYTSSVWKNTFWGGTGFWIELARGVIIILSTSYTMSGAFPRETYDFFHPNLSNLVKQYDYSYVASLILIFLGFTLTIWNHFFKGPVFLNQSEDIRYRFKQGTRDYVVNYQRPYAWYFLYTLTNVLVLGISGVSVSIKSLINNHYAVKISEHKILSYISQGTLVDASYLTNVFQEFKLGLIKLFGVYSTLDLILLFLIIYEISIGWRTLSKVGKIETCIAFTIISITWLPILVVGFNYYGHAFQEVSEKINQIQSSHNILKDFEYENQPVKLIAQLLNTHPNFYGTLILAMLSLLVLLNRFQKKIGEL